MSTKNIFLLAIISFVMIVVIVGSVFFVISYKNSIPQNTVKELYYFDVGEMYCNIMNSKKIVKFNIVVELTDEKLVEEFNNKSFLIKHEINTIMINKTQEDLEGKEGLITLQSEITNRLSEVFNSEDISKVYFEEFIIQ